MIPFKLNLPGCKVRYTGVYTVTYKTKGELYCFNVRVIGKKDLVFRITSKVKNFNTLYSIDMLNKKMNPIVGIEIKDQKDDNSSLVASRLIYKITTGKKLMQEGIRMEDVMMWMSIITSVVAFSILVWYYVTAIIKWTNEKVADSVYENTLNKKLFEGQTGNEPEFEIYNKLIRSITMLIKSDKIKSILLCGIPGTSKTHMVRRTLYFNNLKSGSDYTIIKGSTMSLIDFLSSLYDNRNKIVILDDFDKPLEDPDTVNVLKAATDSYSKRIISCPIAKQVSATTQGAVTYNVPQKFEFTGKIIIITNKRFKEIDKAFISRCLTIELNFTPEEFIINIQKMLKYIMPDVDMNIKMEVFKYIEHLSSKGPLEGLNFRTFQSCVSIRLLYPENWKDMISYILK